MSDYHLLVSIFLFELISLFLFLVFILFHRLWLLLTDSIGKKRKNRLSIFFIECIQKQQPFDEKRYPGRPCWRKELLEILESFNYRFQGDDWETIKLAIAQKYLLPKARKWARSFFWTKRSRAAHCFAIAPLPEDEQLILRLMDDRKFLVRNKAALAAIELKSVEGIRKALQAMTRESGFSHFFYRDALVHASQAAAIQMIAAGADPALHEACLDVLSAKSWALPIGFLQKDLQSKNVNVRRLAISVLVRNPIANCVDILLQALQDYDEKIRIQAAKGLAIYSPLTHLDCLERALSDASWFVRIEAARALKQAGAKGIELLHQSENAQAKEAAQYIEIFG